MAMRARARRNQHLTNLSVLYFVLSGILGSLLLFLSWLYGSRAFIDNPDLGLAFLAVLLTAIGLLTRAAAARVFTLAVSVAVVGGSIWAVLDAYTRLESPSIRAFLRAWDTPIVLFVTLPAIGLGSYGIWAMMTQWSTDQTEARRFEKTEP